MENVEREYYEALIKIGLNVSYYRKLKKITQEELSELVGISRTVISQIEAPDIYYSMRIKTLFGIAKALDISLHKLCDLHE